MPTAESPSAISVKYKKVWEYVTLRNETPTVSRTIQSRMKHFSERSFYQSVRDYVFWDDVISDTVKVSIKSLLGNVRV